MKHVLLQGLSLCMFLFWGCGSTPQPDQAAVSPPELEPVPGFCQPVPGLQTLSVAGYACDIDVPEGTLRGHLLILPGWNFPRTDWCEKSSLCEAAKARGYALILPEMGKSIYHSRVYPETRADWLNYPTGTWLWDTLVPELQENHCLLTHHSTNFVMGLSTGARGAVMATYKLPELFTACVALSGDYDQRLLPKDNLMRGFYGEMDQFPERWSGEDNPVANADNISVALFLGHGAADPTVPVQQTQVLYDSLIAGTPGKEIKLKLVPGAVHDYKYWDSQVGPALDFFDAQF